MKGITATSKRYDLESQEQDPEEGEMLPSLSVNTFELAGIAVGVVSCDNDSSMGNAVGCFVGLMVEKSTVGEFVLEERSLELSLSAFPTIAE